MIFTLAEINGVTKFTTAIKAHEQAILSDVKALQVFEKGYKTATDKTEFFNQTLGKASQSAKDYSKQIEDGTGTAAKYADEQTKTASGLKSMGLGFDAAALGVKALNMAINIGIMLAVSAAIQLVVTSIDNWIHKSERLREEQQKMRDDATQSARAIQQEHDAILSLLDRYKDINKNVSDSTQRKEQLIALQKELVKSYGSEAEGIDLVNGKLDEQIEKLNTVALTKSKTALAELGNELAKARKSLEDTFNPSVNAQAFGISHYASQDNYLQEDLDKFEKYYNDLSELAKDIDGLKINIIEGYQGGGSSQGRFWKAIEVEFPATLQEAIKAYQEFNAKLELMPSDIAESLRQSFSTIFNIPLEEYNSALQILTENADHELTVLQDQVNQLFAKVDASGMTDEIQSQLDTLKAKMIEVAEAVGRTDWLQDIKVLFGEVADEGAKGTDNLTSKINSLFDSISQLETGFGLLSQAQIEFNEKGNISAATLKSLMEAEGNLLQYLEWTSNGLRIKTELLDINRLALIDQTEATLKAALGEDILKLATEGVSDEALEASKAIQDSGNNASEAGTQFANAATGAATLAGALAAVNAEATGQDLDLSDKQRQLEGLISSYQNTVSALRNTSFATSDYGSRLRDTTSSTKAATDAQKEYQQVLKDAQSALKDILSLTIAMLKQQFADLKESLQEQLSLITERYNRERDEIKKTYDEAKKALDKEKKELQKLNKERKKAYDDAKKAEKALYDEAKKRHDAEKKALQEELDLYRKRIKEQIEALRKQEDERDYQAELAEKQNSVSNIEKQLLAIQFDTSESAAKKRRELEEQLAKARAELEKFQHDHSIDLQEDALNQSLETFEESQESKIDALEEQWEKEQEQYEARIAAMEAEYEAWQNYYDARLEAIDAESERLSENHQAELERIEEDYKARKASLDQQIKDIEKASKDEVAIKAEAMRLINEKSDQFYKDLAKYAHDYTNLTDYEFQKLWKSAYDAMSVYNNGQNDVRVTLEILAEKMDAFASKTNNAASSMNKLADAAERLAAAQNSGGWVNDNPLQGAPQYHNGGIAGESSTQRHVGSLKPNEVHAILEKGEPILSNKKSTSDIQNAVAYLEDALPQNDTRALLAAFVNDATSIQDLIKAPSSSKISGSVLNGMISRNLPRSPAVQNYEKIPVGGDVHNHEYHIDNSKEIVGYDVQTMRKIASEQDEKLCKTLNNHRTTRGAGRNYAR